MKKLFTTALLQFLAKFWFTPKNLRLSLLKKLLNLKNNGDVTFKIAEYDHEVLAALEILKKSETHYVPFAYLSTWKINKFLTVPSSTLAIAVHKDKIIAVGGLLIDNPLGMPSEISSEVSRLREKGLRIGELMGLTILKNETVTPEAVGLALNHYICLFAKKHLKVDTLVAPIPSYLEDFYQGVLCYARNDYRDNKTIYSDDNIELEPHFIDLHQPLNTHLTEEQTTDLAGFEKCYSFPKSDFYVVSYSSKSTQIVQKLFHEKSPLLNNLTINDRLTLEKIYSQKSFRNLTHLHGGPNSNRRHHVRFPSACPTVIHDSQEEMQALAIDVSAKGLSLITQNPLIKKYKMAQSIKLTIQLAPNQLVTLEGEVIWKSSSKSAIGICLNKSLPQEWLSFIDYLEGEFVDSQYKKVG